MTTIVVRHRVGDFGTWSRAYKEREEFIGRAASSFKLFQDVDDPNSIVMVIETEEPGNLAALMDDPRFADLKASHTVIDPITISAEVKCQLTKGEAPSCRVDQYPVGSSTEIHGIRTSATVD